jgi:hypothetical protein
MLRKSRMEQELAIKVMPYSEAAEPKRTSPRTDTALPRCSMSRIDIELPNCAMP